MIANLSNPVAAIRGALTMKSPYYARMVKGQCIIQRKPTKTTAKQTAMRKAFGEKYKGQGKSDDEDGGNGGGFGGGLAGIRR